MILTADPRRDAAALDAIDQVIAGGRLVDRDGLMAAAKARRP